MCIGLGFPGLFFVVMAPFFFCLWGFCRRQPHRESNIFSDAESNPLSWRSKIWFLMNSPEKTSCGILLDAGECDAYPLYGFVLRNRTDTLCSGKLQNQRSCVKILLKKTFLQESLLSGIGTLCLIITIEKGPNIYMHNAQGCCHRTCILLNPNFKSLSTRSSVWLSEIHFAKIMIS